MLQWRFAACSILWHENDLKKNLENTVPSLLQVPVLVGTKVQSSRTKETRNIREVPTIDQYNFYNPQKPMSPPPKKGFVSHFLQTDYDLTASKRHRCKMSPVGTGQGQCWHSTDVLHFTKRRILIKSEGKLLWQVVVFSVMTHRI